MLFQKGNKINKGKILSEEHKKKISLNRKGKGLHNDEWRKKIADKNTGTKNPNWRGNEIKKYQRHRRIESMFGTPRYCEICKRTDKKKYEWCNKDHKYSLKVADWQRLCTSCHRKYDLEFNNYQLGYKQ